MYDYALNEALGFHVDFEKTLGQQIDEAKRQTDAVPNQLDEGKVQALIEKIEPAIKDLHRPISQSGTAEVANITASGFTESMRKIGPTLNYETFEYINVTNLTDRESLFVGKVSSYNTNTFKGRIYIEAEGRPVPFTLSDTARSVRAINRVVRSLSANAIARFDEEAEIRFFALKFESKNGRLKGFLITRVD